MTMSFYEQSMKIATHEYKFFHSIYCVSVRRWATSKEKESHKSSNSPKGMWPMSIRFLTIWDQCNKTFYQFYFKKRISA
jgi:hypothetical protein